MMADDNQSSPPSVAVEKTEEGHEEAVVTTTKTTTTIISESETPIAKLTNGDCNGHVATPQEAESQDQDSLEANHVEEYVEEKTYTSETSFVMMNKQPEEAPTPVEETKEEVVVETKSETVETKGVETVETKVETVETKVENVETKVEATEVKVETAAAEVKEVPEEKIENTSQDVAPEETPVEAAVTVEKEATPAEEVEAQPEDKKEAEKESEKVVETAAPEVTTKVTEETKAAPEPILQIEESKQDGDGFVTLEDCLPKVEDATETAHESVDPSQSALSNGHVEPAEANSLPPTPEPSDDKANHPEIEEFVKSGGVKRIIPGVQKTEQPYSTCTTETKIAMEIREMREREEELRIMREQAALSPAPSPLPPAHSPAPSIRSPSPKDQQGTPYRVSSVFGRGTPSPVEEKQPFKVAVAKETAVEREIRLARDREEELRKQKGLPPREDDSYVKPSQVKSSQVRVFGKAGSNVKQAATAKIQLEIEEQTQREIALRETGSIQTISHERTDAKVAKLNTPPPPTTNGSSHPASNGHHVNGRSSPEKRPSAPRPASIFSQGVSMHKFIASKGAPRPAFAPPPPAAKTQQVIEGSVQQLKGGVKRNVESKIQQEIMEMKMREEELKLLHMNANGNGNHNGDSMEHEMNQKNNILEYENGHDLNEEDISPRHNKLIAQWEQRIQKAES